METRVNYTLVGLFVVILSMALLVAIVWLSFGLDQKSYETYQMFVSESVSGLNPKASIKYYGVEVGYVSKIRLSPNDPKKVQILLDIVSGTPISVDTRAELDTQGLTGMAYVELTGGTPHSASLVAKSDEKYPTIISEPSLLFRLDSALDHLTSNVETITTGLSTILDKHNTLAFGRILKNMDEFSQNVNSNTEKLDKIINNADVTLTNTASASKRLPEMMENLDNSAKNFDKLMKQLEKASEQIDATFSNGKVTVTTINDQLLPDVIETFQDLRQTMHNMKNLSAELEENPSVIIRGRQAAKPGPGER